MIKKRNFYLITALFTISGCSLLEFEDKIKHKEPPKLESSSKQELPQIESSSKQELPKIESSSKQEPPQIESSSKQRVGYLNSEELEDQYHDLLDQKQEASRNLLATRNEENQAKSILGEARKNGSEQSIKEKLKLYNRAHDKASAYERMLQITVNDINKCIQRMHKIRGDKKPETEIKIDDH
ncbi:Lipoprotein [Candidatus Liberibacter solanacearum]|uniref:Lipoprotein n=1 Tax=Candidatus Liberibacter solanacearum TaxID=556287 RepID=A0A3R7QTX5_9HYPH|nr:hypothetical protein [Candidatus Liberibacter solanacearum]RPD36804.1 hypothetical protein C0030_005905 [Candidatus Liberibacter solanacearum]